MCVALQNQAANVTVAARLHRDRAPAVLAQRRCCAVAARRVAYGASTSQRQQRRASLACRAGPSDVFVIDVDDGVLQDQELDNDTFESVRLCQFPVYFLSREAPEKVAALLQDRVGLEVQPDSPRLYTQLPWAEQKMNALRKIMERPVCQEPGTTMHYIDNTLGLLQAMRRDPQLRKWALYLTSWGVSTLAERRAAERDRSKGMRLLDPAQMQELLKWGLLQGVDDGCQELADGVELDGGAQLRGVNG